MMRDFLLKDWKWKLFSLFLAAVIWLTVHRILEPEAVSLVRRTSTVTYNNLTVDPVSSTADVRAYRGVWQHSAGGYHHSAKRDLDGGGTANGYHHRPLQTMKHPGPATATQNPNAHSQ
jgi:hypothetical protein